MAKTIQAKTIRNGKFSGFAKPETPLGPGDIVIVGAGLAGLYTALKLAPLPVTIVAAAPLGEGASSVWAQGGIAAAVGEGDTAQSHAHDTIVAGAGIVDEDVARTVAEEAGDRVRDLLRYGVPFDRDLEGHFVLSREAAHSAKRIVRVSGDRAGAAIMQALIAAARATPSIRVLTGHEAEDLVIENGRVVGVRLARGETRGQGTYELIPASAVVLATGGVGGLYAVTTNPAYARGEAIAFAARAGAVIADPEFVQFHPTAIDIGADPAPLATEALRGEGALLVNKAGERFMLRHHPDAELAPRDIVARGVFEEIIAGRGAFLDCRKAIGDRFADGVSDRVRPLQVSRDRPGDGADPCRAGGALSHGRHRNRHARALERGRLVGGRRGGVDGPAWGEPAGVEFALGSDRAGRACGRRHSRARARRAYVSGGRASPRQRRHGRRHAPARGCRAPDPPHHERRRRCCARGERAASTRCRRCARSNGRLRAMPW